VSLESQIATSTQKRDDSVRDLQNAQRDVDAAHARAAALKIDADSAEARKADAEAALQRQQARGRQAASEADDAEARAKNADAETAKTRNDMAALQASIANLAPQEAALRTRLVTAQADLGNAEKAKLAAQQDLAAAQVQLGAAKADAANFQNLKAQQMAVTKAVSDAQAQLAQLKANASIAQQNVADRQGEFAGKLSAIATLQTEITSLTAMKVQLAQDVAQKDAIAGQSQSLSEEIGQRKAEADRLHADLEKGNAEMKSAQQAAEAARATRIEQERHLLELTDQVTRLASQRDVLIKDRNTAVAELAAAQTNLNQVQNAMDGFSKPRTAPQASDPAPAGVPLTVSVPVTTK
jgi:chromosome segregation ATPase